MDFQQNHENVLCLSGGGFRALYTIKFLNHLEQNFGHSLIRDHFKLIAGTSGGAIIAAGLALGIPCRDLEKAFVEFGPRIFAPPIFPINLLKRLFLLPLYNLKNLELAISSILKDQSGIDLESINYPLLIVAVSRITRKHKLFLSQPIQKTPNVIQPLKYVIMASAAAPTYFKHSALNGDELIDGGLVATSPILPALMTMRQVYRLPMDKVNILSIGTATPRIEGAIGRKWYEDIPILSQVARVLQLPKNFVLDD